MIDSEQAKTLVLAACRTPRERELQSMILGELADLEKRMTAMEQLQNKPKPPTVTKPPAKKPAKKKEDSV